MEAFINANRDPKKHRDPVLIKRPWPDEPATEQVSDAEMAELRLELRRRSALAP